jgi:hypothetical protein
MLVQTQPTWLTSEVFSQQIQPAGMDEIDGSFSTRDAQREMILHAEFLVVCRGWNVEHIFDPVAAIGNLNFFSIRIRLFESAVPIHAEAQ